MLASELPILIFAIANQKQIKLVGHNSEYKSHDKMKLSLAAALLGQTVPTLSKRFGPITARDRELKLTTEILEDASPQLTLDNGEKRQSGWHYNRRLMRQMVRNDLKNVPKNGFESMMVPCDPRSTDPDVGILSCGQDSTCEPSVTSSLGGICTPLQSNHQGQGLGPDSIVPWKQVSQLVDHDLPSVTTTIGESVQCDPTSIDIGILACGEGQFCKHDETSGLGGYCVDTTTSSSRRLAPYYLEDYLYMCSYPPGYRVACDCSGVNASTGSGTMYCTQNFTASLVYGCDEYVVYDSFAYSFDNSVIVKARDCYETTAPFTESICFLYYIEGTELVCDAEWNGQRCTSCAVTNYGGVPAFDCSNVDGGRVGDSRKELLSVFDLCSNATCSNFCGEGSFIPNSNFPIDVSVAGDNFTCGELAYSEENPWFPDVFCPYVLEAAQTYCCTTNSTVPPDDDSTSSGGGSSAPGLEPEDNSTINGETDEEEDGSVPGADSDQESSSAGRSIWNFALVACEAAVVMALVSRV